MEAAEAVAVQSGFTEMYDLKKRYGIVLGGVLTALVVSSAQAIDPGVAAWDFSDKASGSVDGWMTVNEATAATGATNSGIAVQVTGGSINSKGGDGQFGIPPNFVGTALLDLSATNGPVYKDWFNTQVGSTNSLVYTISGLTAGQNYAVQLVASFPTLPRSFTVEQDGVPQDDLSGSAGDVVYSTPYSFKATDEDRDVAFTIKGSQSLNFWGLSALVVEAVPEPATSNGVPYAWLDTFYPDLDTDQDYETASASDTDGDGFSAEREYIAATVPTNPASYLSIGSAIYRTDVHGMELGWTAQSGRVYSIWGSTNLSVPFEPWAVNIVEPIYTDTVYSVEDRAFYTVNAELLTPEIAGVSFWYEDNNVQQAGGYPDDFDEMYNDPDSWAALRDKLSVYYIRGSSLRNIRDELGEDFFTNKFCRLFREENLPVAIDNPGEPQHWGVMHDLIDNGVTVSHIALQSVLSKFGGGRGMTEEEQKAELLSRILFASERMKQLKDSFPDSKVGIIDALPTKAYLYEWAYLELMEHSTASNAPVEFIHVDCPAPALYSGTFIDWEELGNVKRVITEELDVDYGFVVTDGDAGRYSNQAFNESVLRLGRLFPREHYPDYFIMMSWFPFPEYSVRIEPGADGEFTMTRTAYDFIETVSIDINNVGR